MNFQGKRIWLIGASEGIGAALALELATAGATVILSARSVEKLKNVAQQIAREDTQILPLDVQDKASINTAWDSLKSQGNLPDIVIYNVGTYEPLYAQQFDLEKIEHMIDVNLHGVLRVLSYVLPAFVARDAGTIVLTGSVAGYRGLPGALGYGLSKAALIHLAENLQIDLARTNVKIRLINPGFVKTQLTDKNDFAMPFIITPHAAAKAIMRGLRGNRFEIHFPKRFSYLLKLLRLLPNGLYVRLMRESSR